MGTTNENILPATTGLSLGNINQQWTLYSANIFAAVWQSQSLNPAQSGTIRLANIDSIAWRNTANTSDLTLSNLGVGVGDLPTDVLKYNGGGIQSTLISSAAAPASTGAVRLGANDAIKFRNNADTADTASVSMNASDQLVFSTLTTANGGSLELGQNPAFDMQISGTGGTNGQRIQISPLNQASSSLSAQLQLVPGANVNHTAQIASQIILFNKTDGTNIEKYEITAGQDQFFIATSAFGTGVLRGFSIRVGAPDCFAIDASGNTVIEPGGVEVARFTSAGLSLTKPISNYQGTATTGAGIAAQVATVNSYSLSAAVGTTLLYTVPAIHPILGQNSQNYRLSWSAKITGAGSVSSTLGALTITYSAEDLTAMTLTAAAQISAGTIATTSTANTTATILLGVPMIIQARNATAINYAFAYAASAANSMVYDLTIILEAI